MDESGAGDGDCPCDGGGGCAEGPDIDDVVVSIVPAGNGGGATGSNAMGVAE